jgi:DNA-binding IclR family transcriptional regulator
MISAIAALARFASMRIMPRKRTTTGGNQTVATGISILKTIAAMKGPATLTEISSASKMLPMRTQRYLKSIAQMGLVSYDSDNGRYDLGPAIIDLGLTALSRLDSVKLASESITRLSRETGLTSLLSVWGSSGCTVIKYQSGEFASLLRVREGSNLPLLTSATGRMFLTYMPEVDTRASLKREISSWSAARGKRPDAETVRNIKIEVRKFGLACSSGGTGHDTIAAPVFDHNGNLCFVITLASAAGSCDLSYGSRMASQLKKSALDLSHSVGYRGDFSHAAGEQRKLGAPSRPLPRSKKK